MRTVKRLTAFLIAVIIAAVTYNLWPGTPLPEKNIDSVVLLKSKRELQVYSGKALLKTYTVSLGRNPIGDKQFEGDGKTPEGKYYISGRNGNSSYHRALRISYPAEDDKVQAQKAGKEAGSDIMIHGLRNGMGMIGKFHRLFDWTEGCIAVTNEEMDELYGNIKDGTVVEIRE